MQHISQSAHLCFRRRPTQLVHRSRPAYTDCERCWQTDNTAAECQIHLKYPSIRSLLAVLYCNPVKFISGNVSNVWVILLSVMCYIIALLTNVTLFMIIYINFGGFLSPIISSTTYKNVCMQFWGTIPLTHVL